jgi:hypothetical protein
MLDSKIIDIRKRFCGTIASKLIGYETAELLLSDGTWDAWPDLPIRLHTDCGQLIAVSWSKFEDLWLANDSSLPFDIEDAAIRWVPNSIVSINGIMGGTIGSVQIGRGEMSMEGRDIEIWTRLFIQVGDAWLEIFNALDENGYLVHSALPTDNIVPCI